MSTWFVSSDMVLREWLLNRDAIPAKRTDTPRLMIWRASHFDVADAIVALRDEGQPSDALTVIDRLVEKGLKYDDALDRVMSLISDGSVNDYYDRRRRGPSSAD